MPGLYGAYLKDINSLSALADKMVRSMDPERRMETDRFVDAENDFMMGRVHLGIFPSNEQPIVDVQRQITLMLHGELYDVPAGKSNAHMAMEQYQVNGDRFAAELSGIFHAVLFDCRKRKFLLISDRFGLQPLYYSVLPKKGFAFSAEIKALLQVPGISKDVDYRSIADFLHFGQVLGTKTLFKDIHLLAPGSVLTYSLDNGQVQIDRYFILESLFLEKGQNSIPDTSLSIAAEHFEKAVQKRSLHTGQLGLSLSGGLDSRAVLAGLGATARGMHTYTLGLSGCADERLAQRLAEIGKTQHEFIPLGQDYLQDFKTMATDMIRLTDGLYHPHESTEMLALEYFNKAPFKILLRGHGGEIAKASLAYPVMVRPEVEGLDGWKAILDYILNITNLVRRDIDPTRLFHPEFQETGIHGPKASLIESIGLVAELLSPADVCIYYYINEHIRRQVVASLDIFRTQIEIRLPFLDNDFLESLLHLPIRFRHAGEVHHELIHRCLPGLLKITNSNTGAPMDAGPLRLFLTDKFNSLMKRLSVKGYRHYTEFQDWHRKNFSETSREIIFGKASTKHKIYNLDYLEMIFNAHVAGTKDYGHLLGTVTALELWFQLFVDE